MIIAEPDEFVDKGIYELRCQEILPTNASHQLTTLSPSRRQRNHIMKQ